MNVKKGDTVKVIAGKDKGKQGEIIRSMPSKGRVVVEKVNVVKKAQRLQRHARVPEVQRGHPRRPPFRRGRQEAPRVQEVRQGHRLVR